MEKTLVVNEIFRTIHGECNGVGGQGAWTIVLRLQGCNLKCSYCDTKYAIGEGGVQMGTSNILKEITDLQRMIGIKIFYPNNILITGGEPLLQTDALIQFCSNLKHVTNDKMKIAVETNGTFAISLGLERYVDSFIVDNKTPSSGQCGYDVAYNLLGENDFIKFLIADKTDFLYACNTKDRLIQKYKYNLNKITFLMSPVEGRLAPKQLYTMLETSQRFDFNINVQLHKIIEVK